MKNKPAFPVHVYGDFHVEYWKTGKKHPEMRPITGMTLREYYAGLCLQGMLSNTFYGPSTNDHSIFKQMKSCCDYADALIKELEKDVD